MNSFAASLDQLGYCIIPQGVAAQSLEELTCAVMNLPRTHGAGARNLAELLPAVARYAASVETGDVLRRIGCPGAFLVRSIFFDKQVGANWKVAWHQDLTIAVCERREAPGFQPWSAKEGIPHVQPPAEILERMVTLRLHLDDCDADNGALRVIPGSHRNGVLGPEAIRRWRAENAEVVCEVARGGIQAMRPLLLHASSQAERPRHRRVIHLEYAMEALPGGLQWRRDAEGSEMESRNRF